MLAQRCDAEQIDAIEIDASAYEQAVDNFENSPWNDRLFVFTPHLTISWTNLKMKRTT
jgi:tRNA1Val (adenine37-N6)-methyltransferase